MIIEYPSTLIGYSVIRYNGSLNLTGRYHDCG